MFKKVKLGTRLALGFGAILCLATVLALSGLGALASVTDGFKVVTNDIWPKTDIANQNIQAAYDYARAFSYIVISEGKAGVDAGAIQAAHGALIDTVKLVNDNVASLEKVLSNDEEKALLAKVKERRAAYGKSRNKVLEMKKAGENDGANELMFTETSALQTVYIQSWKDFIQFEKALLSKGVDAADTAYHFAKTMLISILTAALIIGFLVAS